MKNRRNYYRILHVQPDAHREIIKASYRALMQKLKLHPDLGGDEWNASILNEAYATLTNTEKRAAYDSEYLKSFQRGRQQSADNEPCNKPGQQQTQDNPEKKKPDYERNDSVCPFCRMEKPARSRYTHTVDCTRCHSPLELATRLQLAGKSGRTLQRTSLHTEVRVFTRPDDSQAETGSIHDLSPHGMQLHTSTRLETNQVIKIACNILSATGRVTYCRKSRSGGTYMIGIEFLTLRFLKQSGTFVSTSA